MTWILARRNQSTILNRLLTGLLWTTCSWLSAADGLLILHVSTPQDTPIARVQLSPKGQGTTSPPTGADGKTQIRLAAATRPGDWVSLTIVLPQNLVFISPWDARVRVPPFENEADNFAPVVLLERGARLALQSNDVLGALAERLISAVPLSPQDDHAITEAQRQDVRAEIAREFGLEEEDVDQALRAWGKGTSDVYQKGLAALYEQNYAEAANLLSDSLAARKQDEARAIEGVVNAARFLGRSLHAQGRYGEAAEAFSEAVARNKNDADLLNSLGVSLSEAAKYREAEHFYLRSLEIREDALGPNHPDVAIALNNLASLYESQGSYDEAEPRFLRSLAIEEETLGPNHPNIAITLSNLAGLYNSQGRYDEAEPLLLRSLAIREEALGPDHPKVATALNNLAVLYESQGRYDEVEPLYLRSSAIQKTALGPDHPKVATALNNLAALYESQGRYDEAEPRFLRSLTIKEETLGPNHPDIAITLSNLASLYNSQGRYDEAEPLYLRSLAIFEKAVGAFHPNVMTVLENFAGLLRQMERVEEAEEMEARALAIRNR